MTIRSSFLDAAEMSVSLASARSRSRRRLQGQTAQPKPAYNSRLPISGPKFRDLKRLCDDGIIPVEHRNEYLSLPVDGDIQDFLPETDEEDDIPEDH